MITFIFAVITCSLIILCLLAMIPESSKKVEVLELTPYEWLERETYIRALNGDKSARDWVMKNMFECKDENIPKTDPVVIKDAILALKSIGYDMASAKSIVNNLVKTRVYSTSQQILLDAMRKK